MLSLRYNETMEIIEDIENNRDRIQYSIDKFGFAPDHNLDWFIFYTSNTQVPIVVSWEDELVLVHKAIDTWWTFSEPLASVEHRGQRIVELANYALSQNGIKQVIIEAREDTKKQIIKLLPDNLKIRDDQEQNYVLHWPVMNMEKFDPELPGSHFKSLRNAKNKFYNEHKVWMVDARQVPKEQLHQLINRWEAVVKQRGIEMVIADHYHHLVDGNFGSLQARAMVVDGIAIGLNAGWSIPNSNWYCTGVGVSDYSIKDLNEVLYLEDLEWIKRAGYPYADMEGVEEGAPLNFKNQFLPESWYKTFVFSIVKNNICPPFASLFIPLRGIALVKRCSSSYTRLCSDKLINIFYFKKTFSGA